MNDSNGRDHSQTTHSAKCDQEGCNYVAQTHSHDENSAAMELSHNLAMHNKKEHGKETDANEIKEAVAAKMQSHGHDSSPK